MKEKAREGEGEGEREIHSVRHSPRTTKRRMGRRGKRGWWFREESESKMKGVWNVKMVKLPWLLRKAECGSVSQGRKARWDPRGLIAAICKPNHARRGQFDQMNAFGVRLLRQCVIEWLKGTQKMRLKFYQLYWPVLFDCAMADPKGPHTSCSSHNQENSTLQLCRAFGHHTSRKWWHSPLWDNITAAFVQIEFLLKEYCWVMEYSSLESFHPTAYIL